MARAVRPLPHRGEGDHPLARRFVAEGGFVEHSDRVHRDDESDARMSDVNRIMGEYYGLTLPPIAEQRLPHVHRAQGAGDG